MLTLLHLQIAFLALLVPSATAHKRAHPLGLEKRASKLYLPGGPVSGTPSRVETPLDIPILQKSVDQDLTITIVSLLKPLPSTFPKAIPECDYLSYIRYRNAGSPSALGKADRVLSLMPGTLAGAGSFDTVARNLVKASKKKGLSIEVWALDRRSNCYDDQYGVNEALRTGNPADAVKYYYNGTTVKGRKFAGFIGPGDTPIIAKLGLDQTIKDWYDVVTTELTSQAYRTTKHYIGGHSLGGSLVGYFASFDNDGNVKTTLDAGYNQAAGYIALDSVITPAFSGYGANATNTNPAGLPYAAFQAGLEAGVVPRSLFTLPAILNQEVGTFLSIAGAISWLQPKKLFPFNIVPKNFNLRYTIQFFEAQNFTSFISLTPDFFKAKITGEAAVGVILGDVFQPFSFIATSCGFLTGGKIVQKDFPFGSLANSTSGPTAGFSLIGGLINPNTLAAPVDINATYTWLNYNQVAADGSNVAKARNGKPFTNASSQVTDVGDVSRSLAMPLDFTEHYYPIKLTTDTLFFSDGVLEAAPRTLHPKALNARLNLTFITAEGPIITSNSPILKEIGYTFLPGYGHLDVLQASQKPNGGGVEPVVDQITKFISKQGKGIIGAL